MTIRIVTDSTADIPQETAAALGITVIPAFINIGDRSFLDGVELSRKEFYQTLPDYSVPPTTAAPAPGTFTETYRQLASEGATEILSIHIAASLSGMLNAARLGAEAQADVAVTQFDSQQVTMGLGLLAIVAADAAAAGCSMSEIVDLLNARVERTYVFAMLDTLEYLRRSGRVNWAQFGLGTLLRIKPLVKVNLGQVEIPERVRTSKRAFKQMLSMVTELGPLEEMALLHIRSESKLQLFREETQTLCPEGKVPLAVEVTPAIGAHVGPGGLGIACIKVAG